MQINTILRVLESLGKRARPFLPVLGVLLVLAIGMLDIVTGREIAVSVLYVLPVMLIAWFEGGTSAALISVFSAITWLLTGEASGHGSSHPAAPLWNALLGLGLFLTVGYSFATAKKLLIQEREHASTDYLTGIANARFFYEQAQIEITRSARYKRPLTLAFVDVDDFKYVNATLGHLVGDKLLRAVSETIKKTLRSTDIIARLEGDEFAILMPETKKEHASAAIYKVREQLLDMTKISDRPVTFSIAVVTCCNPTCTLDELITMADDLMYAAKRGGKNTVRFRILDLPPPVPYQQR
jgi:diguanylate cyclase (GGDEF)-like protein